MALQQIHVRHPSVAADVLIVDRDVGVRHDDDDVEDNDEVALAAPIKRPAIWSDEIAATGTNFIFRLLRCLQFP